MELLSDNRLKAIIALLTVSVVVYIFVMATMTMGTDADGNMANCPIINGVASVCTMNVFEHIARWQLLFSVAPTSGMKVAALLFSALVAVFIYLIHRGRLRKKFIFLGRPSIKQGEEKQYSFLIEVFSRGILHPKLYNLALIS